MNLRNHNKLEDDGLINPDIGFWGEEKYRLVMIYATLFAKSMKGKWESLVYMDLYAGAGRSIIRKKNKIINATPLLVLSLEGKFNHYIFNDSNQANYHALKARIERDVKHIKPDVLCEEVNANIEKIMDKMPKPRKNFKVLTFCFLDPFKMDNLKFSTIKALGQRFMDFLILIPTEMDANRNEENYLRKDNTTVENFCGNIQWRDTWSEAKRMRKSFGQFIFEEFSRSMGSLGYIVPDITFTYPIKNSKNRTIYRLALYSKHKLATKFWKETKKCTNPQHAFDFY